MEDRSGLTGWRLAGGESVPLPALAAKPPAVFLGEGGCEGSKALGGGAEEVEGLFLVLGSLRTPRQTDSWDATRRSASLPATTIQERRSRNGSAFLSQSAASMFQGLRTTANNSKPSPTTANGCSAIAHVGDAAPCPLGPSIGRQEPGCLITSGHGCRATKWTA